MPCQKLPLGQTPSGTGYDSIEDCEQRCCGDKPKCPQEPNGTCCGEGETCTETYSGGEWDEENQTWLPASISYACCKPENVCSGSADELGRPYSLCCPDGHTCLTEESEMYPGIIGVCLPPCQEGNSCGFDGICCGGECIRAIDCWQKLGYSSNEECQANDPGAPASCDAYCCP